LFILSVVLATLLLAAYQQSALQLPIAPHTTFTSLKIIIAFISINKSDIGRPTADK